MSAVTVCANKETLHIAIKTATRKNLGFNQRMTAS
jgi:hypothetical protein